MVTGLDLVEWQLRVARGEPLPLAQAEIDARLAAGGHAIEVRLCAEDPARDFLPQTGRVARWRAPQALRVEHALADGVAIPAFYDSMVAKVVAHGKDREDARRRLLAGLEECVLLGMPTNQDFLIECLAHPEFSAGAAHTGFIAAHFPAEQRAGKTPGVIEQAAAAALLLEQTGVERRYPELLRGWSSTGSVAAGVDAELDGQRFGCTVTAEGEHRWNMRIGEASLRVFAAEQGSGRLQLSVDAGDGPFVCAMDFARQDGSLHFRLQGRNHTLRDLSCEPVRAGRNDLSDGLLRAPMNGKVTVVNARAGERISAGQALVVLEAMKMEHAVVAPCNGVLKTLHVEAGEQVAPGRILAEIVAD